MSLKSTFALKKELKQLAKQNAQLELKVAALRAGHLERAVEAAKQQLITFALVDYIFYGAVEEDGTFDEIRTLGEARNRWEHFKEVINTASAETALEELGIEIDLSGVDEMIMDMREEDRQEKQQP